MGKRLGAVSMASVAVAVVTLAVGVVSPAAGASGVAANHGTIRVTAVVTELSLVDVGAQGPSLGDEIVFAEKLLKSHSCPGVTPLRRENLGRSPAVTSDREPGCAGRCRVLGGAFLIGCAFNLVPGHGAV